LILSEICKPDSAKIALKSGLPNMGNPDFQLTQHRSAALPVFQKFFRLKSCHLGKELTKKPTKPN
jgi:hypothetical protein